MRTATKLTFAVMLAFALLGTGSAFAQNEVWCQSANLADAVPSVFDTVNGTLEAITADDFVSSSNLALTSVVWTGVKYSSSCVIDHFIITIYSKDPSCNPPDDANIVSQQERYGFSENNLFSVFYEYETALDPVPMATGQHYWISIVGAQDFGACNGWFWASADAQLCTGMTVGAAWGFPDWTAIYDTAFCLYSDGTVATDQMTWGGVKSLYR